MLSTRYLVLLSAVSILGLTSSIPVDLPRGANDLQDNVPDWKIADYINFKKKLNLPPASAEELSLILPTNSKLRGAVHKYPVDPKHVGFYLYTKENTTAPIRIYANDTKGLQKSGYQKGYKTKLIVHGFLNHLTSEMIQEIKDNFLRVDSEDLNVIAFDWSYYAIFYVDVYEKSLAAGGIIADFINFIVREGADPDNIHCIGHSLGAHACGFGGSQVENGPIARITGLDPAEPGFHVDKMNERLNTNDAKFVDCIHTCGGMLGITEPICTADYYPNSGANQPGCPWYDFGSCSHARSHEFFAESILPGHLFPSVTCPSLNFESEECTFRGAFMGYPANEKYTGILYTKTNMIAPYAYNWTAMNLK